MLLNKEQYKNLEGLAFWVFEEHEARRNHSEEAEIQRIASNVQYAFNELDKLHVPFSAQNKAIAFGMERQTYKTTYFSTYMNRYKIFCIQ